MSAVKNRAPGVEMVLFIKTFIVLMSAVGVLTALGYSMRFPPTVSRTQCFSDLFSFISTTKFAYVTRLPLGTSSGFMNRIVSVPWTWFPTPCASLPNSLAEAHDQIFLSSPFNSCLYSCIAPVTGCITLFALGWKTWLIIGSSGGMICTGSRWLLVGSTLGGGA